MLVVLFLGWGLALVVGLFLPWWPAFTAGVIVGATWVIALYVWDEPPDTVARWLRGAEGERATARALRPLERQQWRVYHDLAARRGNVDHVVLGPNGLFLLETKNLRGRLEVTDGVLNARFDRSPVNDYALTSLAPTLHGRATRLRRHLHERLGWTLDVFPVVVLVSDNFEQERVSAGRLAYVRVDRLRQWLESEPRRIADHDLRDVAAVLDALPPATEIPFERASAPIPVGQAQAQSDSPPPEPALPTERHLLPPGRAPTD